MTIAVHQPRSCTQPRGGFAPKKSKGLTSCVNNRKLGEDFMASFSYAAPVPKSTASLAAPSVIQPTRTRGRAGSQSVRRRSALLLWKCALIVAINYYYECSGTLECSSDAHRPLHSTACRLVCTR